MQLDYKKHTDQLAKAGRRIWIKLRRFDYTDLSFLYIACLFTIAFVYTVFRASQFYLNQQENRALKTIQQIDELRDRVTETERLIALAQNRTAPQYNSIVKQLVGNLDSIQNTHRTIAKGEDNGLLRRCEGRPCADVFNASFFTIRPEKISKDLSNESLRLKAHNRLLKDLYDETSRYHIALKDTLGLSFDIIHSKNRVNIGFDIIAYFALIVLLLLQALYVFRPAIRRLNASLSTRSDFLSRISHEIRNPMNSIIGMADILKGTRLNYEQSQYVNNLIRSGHALLDMLNNLIDFSVIEGGKVNLKSEAFDLFRSIDDGLNLIAIQAHHKNLSVYFSMSPKVPNQLLGDPMRLEQVLINLLNNAVKFTEQGHVALDVDLIREDDSQVELKFSVSDTGIGIKNEQLGEIFESFVQADSSIQRKYGGSGLGLSISSEIIRMMGSKLEVTSTLGKGSNFFFRIAFAKQTLPAELQVAPLTQLSGSQFIFMVAANESQPYRNMLVRLGTNVAMLHSAAELREFFSGHKGELSVEILIDDSLGIISMINSRNLAEESGRGSSCVALIRSNFTKENMDLLKRNGFTRFLIKPLKAWELLSLPPEAADESFAAPIAAAGKGVSLIEVLKSRQLRILLVDDSNDNLFLLKEVMSPLAAQIHFAENGLEALNKFRANEYDAIFMDIQMPVMDGYTAIRKIREMEAGTGKTIPVFAVTAHAGLVDAQKCKEAGFTDRIAKPVIRNDIYKSLARAFNLDHIDAQPADAIPPGATLPPSYLIKLLPAYFSTRFEDLEKLKAALVHKDFLALSGLGHKIKGSAASYGFNQTSDMGQALELAAAKSDLERCHGLVMDLETILKTEHDRSQKNQPQPPPSLLEP